MKELQKVEGVDGEELVRAEMARLALVKRTVAGGDLTDDEFSVFLARARHLGLDPMAGQIFAIKYRDGDGSKLSIQIGIEGLRAIAESCPDYQGQTGPEFAILEGDGVAWVDVVPPRANVVACRVTVHREGRLPTVAICHLREFDKGRALWKVMQLHMLAKCTEAAAIRRAFPGRTDGLYVDAEIQLDDGSTLEPAPRRRALSEARSVDPAAAAEIVDDDAEERAALQAQIGLVCQTYLKAWPAQVAAGLIRRPYEDVTKGKIETLRALAGRIRQRAAIALLERLHPGDDSRALAQHLRFYAPAEWSALGDNDQLAAIDAIDRALRAKGAAGDDKRGNDQSVLPLGDAGGAGSDGDDDRSAAVGVAAGTEVDG